MATMTHEEQALVAGVDTHADSHTAAVLDHLGRQLGHRQFPATLAGYQQLLAWITSHGPVRAVGVEGTGSYGAGLTRHLRAAGVQVWEINRPDRSTRRSCGKSDPVDAEAAARTVLAGRQAGPPRVRDGLVDALRVVHTVRAAAVKARTAAYNQLHHLVLTAPDQLHDQLRPLSKQQRVTVAAAFRPGTNRIDPIAVTKGGLRRLAKRIQALDEEVKDADADLEQLTQQLAPELRALPGVGKEVCAQLLITAGGNPDRLTSEAAFAALCGANPVPASSGKTTRHRLHRGGDRQANRALYVIAINRMGHHEATKAYVARRLNHQRSTRDIIRCLKRLIARQLFPILKRILVAQHQPQAA